jgi:hypothetical protein
VYLRTDRSTGFVEPFSRSFSMTDSDFRDLVPMRQAREELPGKPSYSTMMRWMKYGVKGVHLQSVMIGGRRYFDRDRHLAEFIARTTAVADSKPTPIRSPRKRERDIERAERELAQLDRATTVKTRGQE